MEKIIQIKNAEITEKDGKEWVELTDQEGKLHRIFPRMKRADETWLDMSDKVGELITQVNEGIVGKWMKLTKEKVGQYYNVFDFEFVKEGLEQKVAEKLIDSTEEHKTRGVALRMATDICIAKINKGDTVTPIKVLETALIFESYIKSGLTTE